MRILSENRCWLWFACLPFACATVTTNYPDFDAGSVNAGGGTGGTSSPVVTAVSTSLGGAATGGYRATGGIPVTATGGTRAAIGGTTSSALGGATPSVTGGAATGGKVATGGAPGTGGAFVGDAGTGCASGALFCDDFEAYTVTGTATQWTAGSGTWSIANDPSEPAADQKVYDNTSTSNSLSKVTSGTYTNASIEARIRVTQFSSTSSSNAAGIFIRNNGTNDYDLSLGGDGQVYLRRTPTSSSVLSCTTGTPNVASGVAMQTCSGNPCTGWFRLKLSVSGTVAAGITITGYVDATASGTFTQVLQCTLATGSSYMIDSGSAGVFAKGSAPAYYDDVVITSL